MIQMTKFVFKNGFVFCYFLLNYRIMELFSVTFNTSWSIVSFAVKVFAPTLIGSCCFGKLSAVVPGRTQINGGHHPRGGAVKPSQTGGALVFLLQSYRQATREIIYVVNIIDRNYQKGFLN